jgi:hypothetical protein
VTVSGEDALAAAAALGPFSAVAPVPGQGWMTWLRLVEDPAVLGERVAEVRRLLAAGPGAPVVDQRVPASIVHLGLVARLLSPPLGAALVAGVLPAAPPGRVHLRLAGANPLPLALSSPEPVAVPDPVSIADALALHWLGPAVAPLTATVHERFRLSRRVLTGNVASAAAGALLAAGTALPELAPRATAVLEALLAAGPLAGTGDLRADGSFVRRSCCLFYRLPGAGTCGDCLLTDRTRGDTGRAQV